MTRATLARSAFPLTSPSTIDAIVRVRCQSSSGIPASSRTRTVWATISLRCSAAVDVSGNS